MRLFALVPLVFLSAVVSAQTPADNRGDLPVMGSQATESDKQSSEMSLLVVGDALAGGLWAGMSRRAELQPGLEIASRLKEESGVARPEVYDWAAALPVILEGNDFDGVVVLLGANDRQEIRQGEVRIQFGTPEWAAAYSARVGRIIDAIAAAGLPVYWVAPPPMGDFRYDADVRIIADLQKARVEAKNARFIDVRSAFLTPAGAYTDRGIDDTGAIRKLRASDGVNFFKAGNNRFGQLVLAAIAERAIPAPGKADVEVASKPDAGDDTIPAFGQENVDGTNVEFRPDVTAASASLASGSTAADVAMSKRPIPMPGSSAEKLFTSGESPVAKLGRIDDFSYSPPAQ
jgi:hypothetical protein